MTETFAYPPPPAPQPTITVSATSTAASAGVPVICAKDPTAAVLLEIFPAICLQTFGIGNIYAGNVLVGVLVMFAYWATCIVNALLCVILIGFITWPLTWAAFAIGSSYLAYQKAKSTQLRPA